ncbi:protein mono-ADP-ribosyltransferase PARP12-like [Heteronotia binoei]|uniref:protein mono-ADP-ribosyltransferase PARP12-like n=1 Tax=Heteronotia binoei TaxID=13085 RepID=UPI00292F05BB|nr:protein mono-ADP-ribosyltransferase PARP12-like [Heteronotia binoei]
MEPELSSQALREVCAAGGCLAQDALARRLHRREGSKRLARVLENSTKFALVTRVVAAAAGGGEEQRVVLGVTGARLCREHGGGQCAGQCGQFHLCRYFVYGGCRHDGSRKQCKFIHDVHSPHNLSVLKEHGLEGLTSEELRHLLLQNDPSLLPEICTYYNKGDGPFGSCTFKKICIKLHVCQYYLQGICRFGSDCKHSHNICDPECREKLEKWGLSQIIIGKLPLIYRNMYDIKHNTTLTCKERRSSGQAPLRTNISEESDMICLYHIRKSCSFQDKCIRVHFHLPYRWELLDGTQWKELPLMEDIEKHYCDPFNERFACSGVKKLTIDFISMTCDWTQVRRLSTASSVTKPPHYILTTEWLWYWNDEYGVWHEYGKQDVDHDAASVNSLDLEKAYQSEASPTFHFTAGKQNYVLDFKAMKQKNIRYLTEREVRRRPKFVSLKEIEKKKTSGAELSKAGEGATNIPSHWDRSALPELGYKLITLTSSSNEYRKVQVNFERTMSKAKIIKIKRIQNLALWEVYQWQKEQMKKANGGKDVDEKLLFHGTTKKHVDAICQQNFDWRICGVHGTAYGKGSYFARDASYSDNYCKYDLLYKTMFLARVLVGEFTNGLSNYLRPPAKENQNTTFYDSCVNSIHSPSIFVIFEKHQIYPEYLIEYFI